MYYKYLFIILFFSSLLTAAENKLIESQPEILFKFNCRLVLQ